MTDCTWAPYQQLDLNPEEMLDQGNLPHILNYARDFIPQTNSGRPPYDPGDPNNPANEKPYPGWGKRIKASELSISYSNDYNKAIAVRSGIQSLLDADEGCAIHKMLCVGLQFQTVGFDHPTSGVSIPDGWNWRWVMTTPQCVFESYRDAWLRAGYSWSATPSVELTSSMVGKREWPVGWLSVQQFTKQVTQYTIVPDLRIGACRRYWLDRYEEINHGLGLVCVALGGKSAWFHPSMGAYSQPSNPRSGPWLPSPYQKDSYRAANVQLVREAACRFGPENVTWVNTGLPTLDEIVSLGLPEYTNSREGGITEYFDCWYGSWQTNWLLSRLVAKGAI